MINFYLETDSYLGNTTAGITFSSNGDNIIVNGISGSTICYSTRTVSGAQSVVGSRNPPLVFIQTDPLGTNFTLPSSPDNGTTIIIIRTNNSSGGASTLFAGGSDSIRSRESSTDVTSLNTGLNSRRSFFYYKGNGNQGTWWEF